MPRDEQLGDLDDAAGALAQGGVALGPRHRVDRLRERLRDDDRGRDLPDPPGAAGMSTCISSHGEYSEHVPGVDYVCTRCFVLDENALRASTERIRSGIGVAVFEYAWREDHARAGDAALVEAEGVAEATVTTGSTALTVAAIASTYAAIAQAHYAAANIRTRPIQAPTSSSDSMTILPDGTHVRVDGWCHRCGGTGEPTKAHFDVPS